MGLHQALPEQLQRQATFGWLFIWRADLDSVRNVCLYGALGAKFGRVHRLAVASTAEAVRALCVLLPGFERELMTSRDRGVAYACFRGTTNVGKDELCLAGGGDIRIAPIMTGSKRAGFFQTIIGVTLIVAGFMLAPEYPLLGKAMISAGISLTAGGVIQMLSPQQSGLGAKDSPDNGASYNFNGPVNTQAQGNPVPILYGRLEVGSAVISAGILAQDQAYAGAPLPRAPIPKVYDIYEDMP
jgi:predicted phage tail protein